jgi:N-carbamoyl-L-amino-acid hydrolase
VIASAATRAGFDALWAELSPVGRDPRTGGYRRFAWTRADAELREWFVATATVRGMQVEVDRNGNQWAWWGTPGPGAVVTGSHLDSVPGGGAFDGPLGIVTAFLAVDHLRASGVVPARPLAIVNFIEEEGGRYGIACLGSRLMVGAVDPATALALRDDNGDTLGDTIGVDPRGLGPDPEALARIGAYVELHIEQGRALDREGAGIGVASAIWPHGRWHFCFGGEGNHAGTTRLEDRRDPMLPFAEVVTHVRALAERYGILTTVGRVRVDPNGTNAIPAQVDAWLDARGAEAALVEEAVRELTSHAHAAGSGRGVRIDVQRESWTPAVDFDATLRSRLLLALDAAGTSAPVLPTGAGHDAGILASVVPTSMLFVRNPTGVSHSPEEYADDSDCLAGADALATVLEDLLLRAEAPA